MRLRDVTLDVGGTVRFLAVLFVSGIVLFLVFSIGAQLIEKVMP